MGDGAGEGARYRAFISYSHVDRTFGRRLHRRLERYALPRRLVGRLTVNGPAPARVSPVFRDRDELPAAGDLTAEVRAALAVSGALVVVCSPAAAASPWVAREIELFRELHPGRPVLAALAVGEPAAAFPPALWRVNGTIVEPLAADFRREGDGPRLALLKLVAGVLGLGLDELVQRDVQRRLRGVTAVTAGAVSLALVMSGLTTYALLQRAEAQRQRGEAEAQAEFMQTDLRDQLKGVGRLDVLDAVNQRTLAYYSRQPLRRLPAESQIRYARGLHAMGEDQIARVDPDADFKSSPFAKTALEMFRRADIVTSERLAEQPGVSEMLWAQGQSEYWLGYHAYRSKDRSGAARRWNRYWTIAARLVAADPTSSKYRREFAYAEGNLCTLSLMKTVGNAVDVRGARRHCARALSEIEHAARLNNPHPKLVEDRINRHAWLADVFAAERDGAGALRERQVEERLLSLQIADDPRNLTLRKAWVVQQYAVAAVEAGLGDHERSKARLTAAREVLAAMIAFDPANGEWLRLGRRIDSALAHLERRNQ